MTQEITVINNKMLYAVVAPIGGVGVDKVILHEADVLDDGSIAYGVGNTWIVDADSVDHIPPVRIDLEEPRTSDEVEG